MVFMWPSILQSLSLTLSSDDWVKSFQVPCFSIVFQRSTHKGGQGSRKLENGRHCWRRGSPNLGLNSSAGVTWQCHVIRRERYSVWGGSSICLTMWRVRTLPLNQVTNNTYNLIERKTISLMPYDRPTWVARARAHWLANQGLGRDRLSQSQVSCSLYLSESQNVEWLIHEL